MPGREDVFRDGRTDRWTDCLLLLLQTHLKSDGAKSGRKEGASATSKPQFDSDVQEKEREIVALARVCVYVCVWKSGIS